MQVSCKIREKEFVLKNPVMSAPGGFGNVVEYKDLIDLQALAAVIPNSLMKNCGGPNGINKFLTTPYGYLSSFGPNNMSLEMFIRQEIPNLPENVPPVIVDIKARSMEEMGESVAMAAETEQIAAIEINLNCPYASSEPLYWKDWEKLDGLMRIVRKAAGDKPVIAKAPGGIYPMEEMARVLEGAGTDMFVPFNCVDGCAVNIWKRTLQSGGYFGPGIKPLALSRCREACSVFHIPVIGAGGITCAEDVIEYIMVGAFAVQIGSANLTRPDFMIRLVKDLETLTDKLGIDSFDEIRGCASMVNMQLFD